MSRFMLSNFILNTDSYKCSHFKQYNKDVQFVNSYIESRGGRWNRVLFYGLQGFIKKYLMGLIQMFDINEAEEFLSKHGLPFNREGWEYILKEHNGALPLKIEAVREGSIIPTNNVLVQISNTDPKCAWLTQYVETALLRAIWYPTTVATNSYMCKQIIKNYLELTGTPESIDFRLHDFGARGVSSLESAMIGGSAHLINFKGTDTISGILYAQNYYGPCNEMFGFSIPASEHSTITSWGKEHEADAYYNMINTFSGTGKVYACVIDSYDAFNAIDKIFGSESFKNKIINSGGTLVLRPDSGNPVAMSASCIERLMNIFGYEFNSKGYKVLPDFIRLIYGDGINEETIGDILRELTMRGISADNISFGMGGALLQHFNRDTLRFAMKTSAVYENGKWVDVYKDPITDPGKKSKSGVLGLIRHSNGIYETVPKEVADSRGNGTHNLLETVYLNGELVRDQSFNDVREIAGKGYI